MAKLALAPTPPDDPPAWLYAVCRREALQLARAERRRKRPGPGPCAADIDAEAVRLARDRLPADEGEAVTLHLWGDLSFAQIGGVTGVSAATAHRRYARGLAQLREWLEELR